MCWTWRIVFGIQCSVFSRRKLALKIFGFQLRAGLYWEQPIGKNQGLHRESSARHGLRSQMQVQVAGSDLVEAIGHHTMGDFRPVALATEVAEVKMAQISRNDFRSGISGGFVREMPVTAQDALFKAPGPMRTFLQ